MVKTNTIMRKKYRIKKINQTKKIKRRRKTKTNNNQLLRRKTQKMVILDTIQSSTNKVKCCMCEKNVDIHGTLIPGICLRRHGLKAHRICSKCWWDPKKGFAREDAQHNCPGCEKNMPFTFIEYKNKNPTVIDLTSD